MLSFKVAYFYNMVCVAKTCNLQDNIKVVVFCWHTDIVLNEKFQHLRDTNIVVFAGSRSWMCDNTTGNVGCHGLYVL